MSAMASFAAIKNTESAVQHVFRTQIFSHALLGLTPRCGQSAVDSAFRKLSRFLHPDRTDLPAAARAFEIALKTRDSLRKSEGMPSRSYGCASAVHASVPSHFVPTYQPRAQQPPNPNPPARPAQPAAGHPAQPAAARPAQPAAARPAKSAQTTIRPPPKKAQKATAGASGAAATAARPTAAAATAARPTAAAAAPRVAGLP